MKIMILNPNTTASFTAGIREAALQYQAAGTEIVALNPSSGPETVQSIYGELLAAVPSLEVILQGMDEFDGFIIACFGFELLAQAVRELTPKPVLSITEAAYYMACMLGRKFSVISSNSRWVSLLWDTIHYYGLDGRCASVRPANISANEVERVGREALFDRLVHVGRQALEEDGAEVICLGCAGWTQLDKRLEGELKAPVVDGVVAAMKLMEALLGYGLRTSRWYTCKPLEPLKMKDLPAVFMKPFSG